MYKAYKFRLYPDENQKTLINKNTGCARLIYNLLLFDRKAYYKECGGMLKREVSYYKALPEYAFLKEADSLALANAKLHLEAAYKNFFAARAGFPKFRIKGKDDSYTTNNQKGSIRISGRSIRLPKIEFIRMKQHREIPECEAIKSCTVSKKAGRYYVSILVECEDPPAMKKSVDAAKALGLDYSVPDFYVDSEGRKPEPPKAGRKAQKRLAKLQRRLSRKKKGSKNREKEKLLVQRLCQKVQNQRLDFCHKESWKLADAYDIICLEDMNLKNMSRCLKLGKSVMDGAFGLFRQLLQYKMEQRGGRVVYINKWYPSSKTCSCCGHVNRDLKLSDRAWICPQCGAALDRDRNAAVNIKREGLRMLAAS